LASAESYLSAHPDVVLEERARVVLGHAALVSGDLAEADWQLSRAFATQEALHAREPAGDRFLSDYAETVICLADMARAEKLVSWLEQRARALPRPWIDTVSARNRGLLNAAAGDLTAAEADFERALKAAARLDMPSELGRTLIVTGRLCRRPKQQRRAQECFEEAIRPVWIRHADCISSTEGRDGEVQMGPARMPTGMIDAEHADFRTNVSTVKFQRSASRR
jgi:tetratricopeptide (TPR) repeat protein